VDHSDRRVRKRHRGASPDGRILPIRNLPEEDAGEGFRVEAQAVDVVDVEGHDDGAHGGREVEDRHAESLKLLIRHRSIARTEVCGTGADWAMPAPLPIEA
jgi:hypothetical protein